MRDNRFYHADLGITMAFPRGWIIENQRDTHAGVTRPTRKASCRSRWRPHPDEQVAARVPDRRNCKGQSLAGGTPVTINGMEGYSVLTRSGSPLDNGAGPIRWIALYRGNSVFIFAGASRSARDGKPEADGTVPVRGRDHARPARPRSSR